MAQERGIAAEDIGSLLEAARTNQRSGLLSAEYSQGKGLEVGELYLLSGLPIYARTGKLVGHEALNHLLSWRNIYFSFVTDVPRPVANLSSSVRTRRVSAPFAYPSDVPQPTANLFSTSKMESVGSSTQALAPLSFPRPAAMGRNWLDERDSQPLRGNIAGMERLVPRKIEPERNPILLRLTRRQRLVYFLVDGQRTMADLARTTSKTVLEIEQVLSELQDQGLIAI